MKIKIIIRIVLKMFSSILWLFYYCLRSLFVSLIPKRLKYKPIVGENVLITGGGGGLGRALALRFAKLGANVVIVDIDEQNLKKTKNLVEKQFRNISVMAYVCDITDVQMINKTAEKISKDLGFVSILVNNAGVLYGKTILELTEHNIRNTLNVNTLSNFWTIREFLPNMLTANKGHIITIASICGKMGSARMADYAASKHAVMGLNESLRYELLLRPNNRIHTTVVLPTFFNTNLINGVKATDFLTVCDVNRVADDVIDGVLTNEEIVAIPKYLKVIFFLKAIIPIKALDHIYEAVGGSTIMNSFKRE